MDVGMTGETDGKTPSPQGSEADDARTPRSGPKPVVIAAVGGIALALLGLGFGVTALMGRPTPEVRPAPVEVVVAPPALDLPKVEFRAPRGALVDPDDPTSWMRDARHADALKQMALEIAHTDAETIRRLPYFADVREQVERTFRQGVFNNYSPAIIGEDVWSIMDGDLYRQDGRTRVIDAAAVSGFRNYSFDNYVPSPDGKYVAFVVSDSGSEFGYARILDVTTQQVMPQTYGPLIGDGGLDWIDATTFAYTRTPTTDLRRGDPSRNNVAYMAKVGERGPGVAVLGPGVGSVPVDGRMTPVIWGSRPNSQIALGVVFGVTTAEFWMTPRAALLAGRPAWTRLAGADRHVEDATPFYNWIVLVQPGADGRPQLAAYDIASGQTRVVREGANDLFWTASWAADDVAYVFARNGGSVRLFELSQSLQLREIDLPFAGSLSEFSGVYGGADQLTFKLSSLTEPEHFIRVRDGKAEVVGVAAEEPGHRAAETMRVSVEFATSADGTKVPVTIVEPREREAGRTAPTLLHAYGAYGTVEMDERSPPVSLWVQLGGIDANCHVRGGGYYGKAWHEAGKGPDKTKSHEDLVACAQYLVSTGRTQPAQMALEGGSAGGMVVGPVALTHPELFRAVVFDFAQVNPLDSFDAPNGAAQIEEYGDAANPEDARRLRTSDTLLLARTARAVPDMLFCFGLQDRRVSFWESTRLAETVNRRFPDANVAILTDEVAGHSCGFAESARESLALKFAWLLAELDPGREAPAAGQGEASE
jgi:prolyl oligopeptidase